MSETPESSAFHAISVVTDGSPALPVRPPAVYLHTSVMAALALPDFTLVTVARPGTGRSCAAWAVASDDEAWDDSRTPWHRTVRLSRSAWHSLGGTEAVPAGAPLRIRVPRGRLEVTGVLPEQLIGDAEVGLHRDDAARLGIGDWAVVNHNGVPAALRVRPLDTGRPGAVRLPRHTRLLLGLPGPTRPPRPEVLVTPLPCDRRGRPLLPPAPARMANASLVDRALTALVRAPAATLRTAEAEPGEDQELTVRLPPGLFPLLGTVPGRQVYVEWGPAGRAVATALVGGDRLSGARVRVGSGTRAALGVPRHTVVTVRRRVTPLVAARSHQLILPVTGLFIALAAGVRGSLWLLALAVVVVLTLLLAPLRGRRTGRAR